MTMNSYCLNIMCAVFLCFSVYPTQTFDLPAAGAKMVHRLYLECARADDGFSPCLKKRAIAFVDRLTSVETLPLAEGLQVVRTGIPVTQKSVEGLSTTRSLQERDLELTDMLIERVANYLNTRTVQITFPPMTSDELGRSVEEGRGKMKKMMGMMMMGFAMKMAAMIPIALAGLFVLAGKALIISKIALLLAGIIGLKKLLSSKQGGGGGGHGGGWSSGGGSGGWSSGGGGGGWDKRSFSAQELAYNAHVK